MSIIRCGGKSRHRGVANLNWGCRNYAFKWRKILDFASKILSLLTGTAATSAVWKFCVSPVSCATIALVFREIEGVEINPHKIGHASSWPVRSCEGLVIGLSAFGSWLIQLVNERKQTTFFQRLNHFWNHCVSIDFGLHF